MNSITFHSGKVACRITKDTNNIRDCQISIESILLTIRMELSQFTKTQATWLRLKKHGFESRRVQRGLVVLIVGWFKELKNLELQELMF